MTFFGVSWATSLSCQRYDHVPIFDGLFYYSMEDLWFKSSSEPLNNPSLKVPTKRIFFIILFERAFKMIKNGVYFIVIAQLFKISIYAN